MSEEVCAHWVRGTGLQRELVRAVDTALSADIEIGLPQERLLPWEEVSICCLCVILVTRVLCASAAINEPDVIKKVIKMKESEAQSEAPKILATTKHRRHTHVDVVVHVEMHHHLVLRGEQLEGGVPQRADAVCAGRLQQARLRQPTAPPQTNSKSSKKKVNTK